MVITSDVNDYYISVGRKPFIRRQGFFSEVASAPVIDRDKMDGILEFLLNNRRDEAKNCIADKRRSTSGSSPQPLTASSANAVTAAFW